VVFPEQGSLWNTGWSLQGAAAMADFGVGREGAAPWHHIVGDAAA